MREIKFRAWDNVRSRMLYIGEESEIVFSFDSNGIVATDIAEESEEFKALHHLIYMQYTELKDKNGKEIYEGDIVTWFVNDITRTAPVYYDTNQACFWMGEDINGQGGLVLNDWMRGEYEIIGNIYENPTLL